MSFKGIPTIQALSFALLCMASHVQATTLQSIEFSALDQDSFQIEMQLSDTELVDTQIYVIEEPARIVVDLPAVTNEVAQREYGLSFANASEAILLGTPERTRLVLNLERATEYEASQSGNSILLRVGSSTIATPAAASTQGSAPIVSATAFNSNSLNSLNSSITDFAFNRGEEGEGNIYFEFDGNRINSDVSQTGGEIVLRFFGTDLPNQYERIFDVVDFATPVRNITIDELEGETAVSYTHLTLPTKA